MSQLRLDAIKQISKYFKNKETKNFTVRYQPCGQNLKREGGHNQWQPGDGEIELGRGNVKQCSCLENSMAVTQKNKNRVTK